MKPGHAGGLQQHLRRWQPIVGVSLEGFRITVLPVTSEATVMPTRIAEENSIGGITTPTPSGMYTISMYLTRREVAPPAAGPSQALSISRA